MIDKELIHQAAEDIDLFNDDLTEEFDRIKAMSHAPRKKVVVRWMQLGISAAACLVCAFLLYSHFYKEEKQIAQHKTHPEQVIRAKTTIESNRKGYDAVEKQTVPYIAERKNPPRLKVQEITPQAVEQEKGVPSEAMYASNTTSKQDECGMDVHSSQLRKEYGVDGQEVSCNNEDKQSGTVPDGKEMNLINRFQQIACRYDENNSYSHQHFYFQIVMQSTNKSNIIYQVYIPRKERL